MFLGSVAGLVVGRYSGGRRALVGVCFGSVW